MTRLERRQNLAARVLAVGGSDDLAGQVAGRSARTIRRWTLDPRFVTMIESHGAFKLPADEVRLALGVPESC